MKKSPIMTTRERGETEVEAMEGEAKVEEEKEEVIISHMHPISYFFSLYALFDLSHTHDVISWKQRQFFLLFPLLNSYFS